MNSRMSQFQKYIILILILLGSFLAEWKIIDYYLQKSFAAYSVQELEEFRKDAVSYMQRNQEKYANPYRDSWHLNSRSRGLRRQIYDDYSNIYMDIVSDVSCFPIEKSYIQQVNYVDSWYGERTFGGNRVHEGTDIMSDSNISGEIPIVSMTDGTIQNIGWLTLGGWRVGVKSESGIYYYYAHLDSYAPNLAVGDTVSAGQFLGFMGNSGYGEEGTTGMFDVHLHLGIYMYDDAGTEISINPYPFLTMFYQKKY